MVEGRSVAYAMPPSASVPLRTAAPFRSSVSGTRQRPAFRVFPGRPANMLQTTRSLQLTTAACVSLGPLFVDRLFVPRASAAPATRKSLARDIKFYLQFGAPVQPGRSASILHDFSQPRRK